MALTRFYILRLKWSKIDFFQLILGELTALPGPIAIDLRVPTYKEWKGRKGT